MNINITQDNTRQESLGAKGANLIHSLSELAQTPGNTVSLRGNISSLTAYEDDVNYLNTQFGPNFTVNATTKYMTFVDPEVQAVLKTSIGDGTGVSRTMLENYTQNANTLGFQNNTSVTSFPELYNTKIATIGSSAFNGCTNLHTIGIPPTVTYIDSSAFNNYIQNLIVSDINHLLKIQTNGWKLEGARYPITTTAENNMHIYIGSISPENLVKDMVYDPLQRTATGVGVFVYQAVYVETLKCMNPNNGTVNSFHGNFGASCKALKKLFVDEGYTSIGYWMFSGSGPFEEIWLPSTFVEYGASAFREATQNNCKLIYFATTPPTFTNSGGAPWTTMYVPDSAVQAYKDSGYSSYASTIYSLSQLANTSEYFHDKLVERGCTVTGASLGNYVVKAPNEL